NAVDGLFVGGGDPTTRPYTAARRSPIPCRRLSRATPTNRGVPMRVARECVRSVLALLVAVGGLWLVAPSAVAAEQTVDDIVYEYDASSPSSGATVIDYTGPGGAVTIPDRVTLAGTTYDVVGIGAESFRSKALTELTVPDSVTTIGNSAFRDNALTSLTIPDSITAIGEAAFQGNRIADLDLGTGLTTIGVDVFRNNALTELTIPA